MRIRQDDLRGSAVQALIGEHLAGMAENSPPQSIHALGLGALRGDEVTFWSVWQDAELLGCGALKEIDPSHGEVKSMRTATAHLRKGVTAFMLNHIVAAAVRRGYGRLSL
ncbi:MAG: GNAT family N-acetyltransferase, partial [Chromatiales bacterium]|nr:GNAT family N-acetyltransferase [Chromatiales bacterium]